MEKLTIEWCRGDIQRYFSPAPKEAVVQKLGAIEHKSEELIEEICDKCHWLIDTQSENMQKICEQCPLKKLAALIGV
ncbi:MAG: hypothetical protein E7448_03920 [Ruminococcaceae bacterium]|nr:hypothetical protein [Oscillospiraceae bacterium]